MIGNLLPGMLSTFSAFFYGVHIFVLEIGGLTPDLGMALQNLSDTYEALKALVAAISFITGVALIFRGIAMYRIFANQTFGSAQRGEFAGPMVFIIVGAILVYYPSTIDISLQTIFGPGSSKVKDITEMIAYDKIASSQKWAAISGVLVKYMTLIGFIAFIRGWIILSKMGHSGSQPGSIAKGITHLVGGILLMNIVGTVNLIAATFGFAGGG